MLIIHQTQAKWNKLPECMLLFVLHAGLKVVRLTSILCVCMFKKKHNFPTPIHRRFPTTHVQRMVASVTAIVLRLVKSHPAIAYMCVCVFVSACVFSSPQAHVCVCVNCYSPHTFRSFVYDNTAFSC